MLRCRLDNLEMARLDPVPLVDARIRERYDLHEMIPTFPIATDHLM